MGQHLFRLPDIGEGVAEGRDLVAWHRRAITSRKISLCSTW